MKRVVLFIIFLVLFVMYSNANELMEIKFTDIEGFRVGHAQDEIGVTGCTVIICEKGALAGVSVRGGGSGTRETALLDPKSTIQGIHAVVLSGGSAYGLDASAGVMSYLEEKNIGFDVGVGIVPIVCAAVLFDLNIGSPKSRPDKAMGYQACLNSETYNLDLQGNIGAGFGATVGKFFDPLYYMKGGLGSYAVQIGELQVGAIVAVNAIGDVIDPETRQIIAGAYDREKKEFINTEKRLMESVNRETNPFQTNTTIGVIITNAVTDKA